MSFDVVAYYIVKVKCNQINLIGKDGEEAKLKNGMACNAKISPAFAIDELMFQR